MSKVLIDRALLERVQERLDPHRDAVLWGAVCDTFHAAPSGTPAMPVKAYYYEAPNEYGGFNKSVGLEVRKAFIDAPLVLESDALTQIACLEGEIAKRDARILELESQYQRDVYGLNNEGDPIGGDPAGGYANDNARLRAELAAIKAQEPVARLPACPSLAFAVANLRDLAQSVLQHDPDVGMFRDEDQAYLINELADLAEAFNGDVKLYAAPVSEAKAQGDAWAPSVNDYDHSIHSNPDAREWADFFVATFPGLADKHDLMIGWFANAMMAMHDHLARKAQGVVQWPNADEIMQMAFEEGQPADDASGYYFELEEFDLFIERLMSEVARLNAAPVQQVSVPDGYAIVPIAPTPEMIKAALDKPCFDPLGDPLPWSHITRTSYAAMLAAAPAAPAADAGLVEARKANNELVNDLHVMTNKRRQLVDALTYLRECLDPEDYMGEISMHDFIDDALAANSAKGVL